MLFHTITFNTSTRLCFLDLVPKIENVKKNNLLIFRKNDLRNKTLQLCVRTRKFHFTIYFGTGICNMVTIMETHDTDSKVDENSLVSIVLKGLTCEKKRLLSPSTPSANRNKNTTCIKHKTKISHVSPLDVFGRKFNIGARSKSMSESLPDAPKGTGNQKNKRDVANYDTGRNCRTPKRLQHQRNVKLDDDDDEELVFDYSNLSFHTNSRTRAANVKTPKCQIATKNLGDNKSFDATTSNDIQREGTTNISSNNCSCCRTKPFLCEFRHGMHQNVDGNASICDDNNYISTNTSNGNRIIEPVTNEPNKSIIVGTFNTQSSMGVFSSIQPSIPSVSSYQKNPISTSSKVDALSTASRLPTSIETPSTASSNPSGGACTSSSLSHRPDTNRDSLSSPSTNPACNTPCSSAVTSSLSTPLRVGFYEIEKTIGRGNFAVVKLARHRITKTEVILL